MGVLIKGNIVYFHVNKSILAYMVLILLNCRKHHYCVWNKVDGHQKGLEYPIWFVNSDYVFLVWLDFSFLLRASDLANVCISTLRLDNLFNKNLYSREKVEHTIIIMPQRFPVYQYNTMDVGGIQS